MKGRCEVMGEDEKRRAWVKDECDRCGRDWLNYAYEMGGEHACPYCDEETTATELAAAREENQQLRKMWKDEYMQGQKSVGGEPTDEEAETALDAALKGGAKWK